LARIRQPLDAGLGVLVDLDRHGSSASSSHDSL